MKAGLRTENRAEARSRSGVATSCLIVLDSVPVKTHAYTHVKTLVNTAILSKKKSLACMLSGVIVTLADVVMKPYAEENCSGIQH